MSMQERENSGRSHKALHSKSTDYTSPLYAYMHRKTLRLAAALLQKVVDSLAPALTSLLVRGKEVRWSLHM